MTDDGPRRPRQVALVGRANAGKTSIVMHLTGTAQRPVNFPGTSVERTVCGVRHAGVELCVTDLPGIASLRPVSRDERVTLDYLAGRDRDADRPDIICAVLDATRLPVELRFLEQLRSLGVPIVVALTKVDVSRRRGQPLDTERLGRAIGMPLVVVDGRRGDGAGRLLEVLASDEALRPPPPVAAAAADPLAGTHAAGPVPARVRTRSDRLDAFLLHPLLGPIVLVGVLLLAFQTVFTVAEPFMEVVEAGQAWVVDRIRDGMGSGWLRSLIVDGIVNGLGTVLLFVPQIALLMALVAVLESSGYMARAVFLLDRLLRRVGLTGKSFVPLSSSFACAIPGILAARIIDDERDRLATILVAPLMSCSARLPVYVVLLAAFFPAHQAGLLLFGLYLLGVVAAFVVAFALRRTILRGGTSMLAMEMPVYHLPPLRHIVRHVWSSVREFLRTAGTVILAATVLVWALGYFPRPAEVRERFEQQRAAAPAGEAGEAERRRLDAAEAAAYLEQSYLASIGRAVQPVFEPAGFDWKLTVGILAAFPARELVVPTLGTLHSLGEIEPDTDADAESVQRLRTALRSARNEDGTPAMTGLTALAVLAFFALCSQCASTLATILRETHSWKWPVFTVAYMTTIAWLAAVLIYQVGRALGY